MFKVGRKRNEKIKMVFKLQFQATQVPLPKSRLMISLVPVDVGQPTVRLGKALVQNGVCTWKNPVYETVKFTLDAKTGTLQDKIYQFVISTGSSKSGFFGDVLVDLADYVEATSPFTISVPINSSFPGAILHVTIQNTQGGADDQKESQIPIEANGTPVAGSTDVSLRSQFSNTELDEGSNHSTKVDEYYSTTPSLNAEGRKSLSNDPSTLKSLFKQKENKVQQMTAGNESENTMPKKFSAVEKGQQERELAELYWSSDDDVTNFVEKAKGDFPKAKEQEPPKTLVEELKREILELQRQADVTDIEVQSLRRQVVKETKRGQELSNQVIKVKEEKDALMGTEDKKSVDRTKEVEEDLLYEKGLNKTLRSQLRKTQDSNSELILVVRDLEEKLNKKEKELKIMSTKTKNDDSEDELDSNESIDFKEMSTLQKQIKDLQNDLESNIKERKQLENEIQQYAQDYEMAKKENNALSSRFNQKQLELIKKERECTQNLRKIEELESQIARLENVLKKQADEFSENSDIIIDLENQTSSLKNELERQAIEFEDQEKRAFQAEENLRRTKLDNASAAQRLQKEFRELSEELESKFNENEELSIKSEAEAKELRDCITILEEKLRNAGQDHTNEVEKISRLLKEKEKEFEQLSSSHKGEKAELSRSHKKFEDRCDALSNENLALRMEVERLTEENYYFTKQLEEIKRDRDELEAKCNSAQTEINQSQKQLKNPRTLTEKVDELEGVKLQLEHLQDQHNELQTRLGDMKSENDNLREQVSRQKENLQRKKQDIAQLEKFKDSSSKEVSTLKEKVKQLKSGLPEYLSKMIARQKRKNLAQEKRRSIQHIQESPFRMEAAKPLSTVTKS